MAVKKPAFPKLRVFPLGEGFPGVALHHKGAQKQEDNRQRAPDGLEGKGADGVHAHTLGDKAEAPDNGRQQQKNAALQFLSHHSFITGE